MAVSTSPLSTPTSMVTVASDTVVSGPLIPALDRIKLFSSSEWEDFVLEWADSWRSEYSSVERCGGSGDMGRDIIATVKGDSESWDNYQCKHYNHPLRPSDIWLELGKLIYYTYLKKFTYPRAYAFVAPQGAGTKLSNLLRKPKPLKQGLKNHWASYCRSEITSTTNIELRGKLLTHLNALDFSIFSATSPLKLIAAHAKTRWHVARFGGGLPPRPEIPNLPEVPNDKEAGYIGQLWLAYGDHLQTEVTSLSDLSEREDLAEHLTDSRAQFYSAEALRTFSRDTLPPHEFEKLQDEILEGVRDEVRAKHPDGYARVIAVVKTARTLQLTNHALISKLSVRDRGGICHQLANENKVAWVRKK